MSTEAPSPRTPRWVVTLRLVLATFICLLILAITLPNLGRPELSTHTIKYGWPDGLCIAMIVAPLILILAGAAKSRLAEGIGWALLLILLVLRFTQ
jgi:hypothetical protein